MPTPPPTPPTPLTVTTRITYAEESLGDAAVVTVGPVSLSAHESDIHPGAVNIEVDGNLDPTTGTRLHIHINDQLVWDSAGAGGDPGHLLTLTGPDLAEATAVALADAVREAVLIRHARDRTATLDDYLDAAVARLYNLADQAGELERGAAADAAFKADLAATLHLNDGLKAITGGTT